ncbi:MAG: diguanylate cyclase [Cocleimonas sp.]
MFRFFTKSISRMVMASFVFVLLLPLGFIIANLNQLSWDSTHNEMQEKHLLLAKSLEDPVKMYFSSHQKTLGIFANWTGFSTKSAPEVKQLMGQYANSLSNIVAISYLPADEGSPIINVSDEYKIKTSGDIVEFEYHPEERKYRKYDTKNSISSVIRSTVSNKPIVLIKHHIIDFDSNKKGTVFIELGLKPIQDICSKIKLGEKGHCTIVDQLGQVVAHPNKEYVKDIISLSSTGILNQLKNNNSGLFNFNSPYFGEEEVSGFSKVSGMGWGILVAQPKSELKSPYKTVISTVTTWLAVGIIVSLLLASILAFQITKPLNTLVTKSKEIGTRSDTYNLGSMPKNSPFEISELWSALSALVNRLHKSNREVRKLNYSLNKDIEKATAKLRATNKYLYEISSNDHLTNIANRRYFENTVNKILKSGKSGKVGIIQIDVDKFKYINDEYGHEAGDLALVHIASMMKKRTRDKDIPARLGGDEFVVYINNCSDKVLLSIAESLRKMVEDTPINWQGNEIKLSLSMGIVNCDLAKKRSLDQLLKFADEAMYDSKKAGRNHVSVYTFPEEPVKKLPSNKTLNEKGSDQKHTENNIVLAKEIEGLLKELPHAEANVLKKMVANAKKRNSAEEPA